MFLPTHCIALAYNRLQRASTLWSMSTKAELSEPYRGKWRVEMEDRELMA